MVEKATRPPGRRRRRHSRSAVRACMYRRPAAQVTASNDSSAYRVRRVASSLTSSTFCIPRLAAASCACLSMPSETSTPITRPAVPVRAAAASAAKPVPVAASSTTSPGWIPQARTTRSAQTRCQSLLGYSAARRSNDSAIRLRPEEKGSDTFHASRVAPPAPGAARRSARSPDRATTAMMIAQPMMIHS